MDNVAETTRKGRSFEDVTRGVIDKSGAASDSAKDPPTWRKGRAFPGATEDQAGKIGAASGSPIPFKTRICKASSEVTSGHLW